MYTAMQIAIIFFFFCSASYSSLFSSSNISLPFSLGSIKIGPSSCQTSATVIVIKHYKLVICFKSEDFKNFPNALKSFLGQMAHGKQ